MARHPQPPSTLTCPRCNGPVEVYMGTRVHGHIDRWEYVTAHPDGRATFRPAAFEPSELPERCHLLRCKKEGKNFGLSWDEENARP